MLTTGKALKVSITVSDGAKYHGASSYASILDFLFYRGVSGATVLKGIAGFGADHHLHSTSVVEVSDKLPIRIEFVETREKVTELMGKLEEMAGTGLIEVQETTLNENPEIAVAVLERLVEQRTLDLVEADRLRSAETAERERARTAIGLTAPALICGSDVETASHR